MTEVADCVDMLCGFEEHNSCRITVEVSTEKTRTTRTLVLTASAWSAVPENTEAPLLASVSVRCSAMNLRAWNSALTHVMYALDFQLALLELGHAEPKKA